MNNLKQDTFKINIYRNFWEDRVLFLWDKLELKQGVNILVGCNGSGKSTLLSHLNHICEKKDNPCVYFDNLSEGGKEKGFEKALEWGNSSEAASFLLSSEGEAIDRHMGLVAYQLGQAFRDNQKNADKPFFILIDALDSGLSIDNIIEIKKLFQLVLDKEKRNVYIVVAANEYVLARGQRCLDVTNGKYLKFNSYEDYRDFILNSRKTKNRLIEQGEICEA